MSLDVKPHEGAQEGEAVGYVSFGVKVDRVVGARFRGAHLELRARRESGGALPVFSSTFVFPKCQINSKS